MPVTPVDHALRLPPHNEEAEQGVLGTILHNNKTYWQVAEFLRAEHFAHPIHARIYTACQTLIERSQIADVVTLRNMFEHDDALKPVGGAQYLGELVAALVTTGSAKEYGRVVHDCYMRREMIDIGEELVNDAHSFDEAGEVATSEHIEKAESRLFHLAETGSGEVDLRDFHNVMLAALAQAEKAAQHDGAVVGVATGLSDLDSQLGGLHPSDLIVLAGRPSMGKTALATNIAFKAAVDAHERGEGAVAVFSLEMSSEQLVTRILAEQAQIPSHQIRQGKLSQKDFDDLVAACAKFARLPLFIDDSPALATAQVRARARRTKRQHGVNLVIVDYLQLLRAGGRREENRVQELSKITRDLKALAKELNVPILALSQLSRAVEQREDKHPVLADLRESGSIEQDADVVLLLYREEYYLKQRQPAEDDAGYRDWQHKMAAVANLAEVDVAKQRHGPTGRVPLHFQHQFTRFSDLVRR